MTIARTFAGRAHRAPYFSFDPQIICGTIGNRRPACGPCRRQRQSVARCGRRWQGGGFRLLQRSHLLLVAYASVHRPWSRNTRVLRQGHERRVPSAQVNVLSSTVRQEVSYARFAGMCQTRERECAKHLSDKPFAQVHVRKKHLKSQTKSWLFCENPPFFPGEYQNGTLK